ncbi:phosphate-starvation-inducible protein PsiE [Candidatus Endoriftia persephone]|jgi:protein PsiE|uniref:Protein PsiE n=1 Tax=Candidatus Endoriftia persephonae TaxID=393765 RepID=A0A9J6ZUJ4_9GAMM|nr:phosphate-starvation-inducible PsiE family protein [Candidatus Endoriftia persephone]USF86368.1 phosphate-starvation-inducible PsiE family protein [Candidatus Endoriftia persephone]
MSNLKESGYKVLAIVEDIGLLIIALSTVIAIGFEVIQMFEAMKVTLADLLLLFIYLEVLTMIGIYLKTGQLPVRVPLYIAIVAIARYVILDMKNLDTLRMLGLAGAVLLISISILAIRYGHNKFPYNDKKDS